MSQERIEAAAVTLCEQLWENAHERQKEYALEEATVALAAADAVTFSDEAIERASEALYDLRRKDPKTGRLHLVKPWADLDPEMKPFYRDDVRAVVAALRGDA